MDINANGIPVHCEINGSGPYLTMIHGAGNNLHIWSKQAAGLAEHFSILTYDIRGNGRSGSGSHQTTPDMLVEDLRCLLERLGISNSIILGHSMGAEIAIRFYLDYPQMVNAIIICNSIMGALRSEKELTEMRMKRGDDQPDNDDNAGDLHDRIARLFSPNMSRCKPDVIAHYKETMLGNKIQRSQRERMLLNGIIGRLIDAPSANARHIACPALVINGSNDSLVRPSVVESVAHCFNNMRVEVLDTGHFPFLELPDEFNSIVIDFAKNNAYQGK
ncbi:alpha/beta fold hydrolase [Chloroflexota bacterium]